MSSKNSGRPSTRPGHDSANDDNRRADLPDASTPMSPLVPLLWLLVPVLLVIGLSMLLS